MSEQAKTWGWVSFGLLCWLASTLIIVVCSNSTLMITATCRN